MLLTAIKASELSKRYGKVKAVDEVTFEVKRGSVFGFLGPNGAGKSTTQRILTGVVYPDGGSVEIMGESMLRHPVRAKKRLGVVPEQANVYADLTAWENLMFIGEIYNVDKQVSLRRAEENLELFGLYERRNYKTRGFSRGMKQRLLLCMALMNDPDILFLDEPTSGLDVESKQLIRQMIKSYNAAGKTVFLTTHDIEEANQLCDEIAIINKGKIAVIDSPFNLRQSISRFQSLQVTFDRAPSNEYLLKELYGVESVKRQGDSYVLYSQQPGKVIPSLGDFAEKEGLEIVSVNTQQPSLEEVFLYFIGKQDEVIDYT